jgi:hypothetical protein
MSSQRKLIDGVYIKYVAALLRGNLTIRDLLTMVRVLSSVWGESRHLSNIV